MEQVPSPFFDKNLAAPPSKVSLERYQDATATTYAHRHSKVAAIQLEIQVLLDTLANLVQAEMDYHGRMHLFTDENNEDDYASTSAPEYKLANRATASANFKTVDPRIEVTSTPAHPVSEPRFSLALEHMRTLLDDVDRNVRLYSHRVRNLRLTLNIKAIELERLQKEEDDSTAG